MNKKSKLLRDEIMLFKNLKQYLAPKIVNLMLKKELDQRTHANINQ